MIFSVKEASDQSGVNPTTIRMWEARYGWPKPGRRDNGYRYYLRHQVDELKRMKELIRQGHSIGHLIHEGLPLWPSDERPARPDVERLLAQLPAPRGAVATEIRRHVDLALIHRDGLRLWEMALRTMWEVHPSEQALTGWLPYVVAAEAWEIAGQPLPDRARLEDHIQTHLRKLIGRQVGDALQVVPTEPTAVTAALVAALLSIQHGHPARVEDELALPDAGAFVTVGRTAPEPARVRGDRYEGHLTLVDDPRHRQVAALIDQAAYGQAV